MKGIKKFLIYLFGCLYIVSCTVVKTSEVIKLNFAKRAGQESGGDYIKFKDGKKIKGKISKYRVLLGAGLFGGGNKGVTMDDKEYDMSDIVSFQKDSAAFVRHGKSKIFLERKMAGKINVYYRHYNEYYTDRSGRGYNDVYDLHWLQKGEDAPLEKYNIAVLEKMVSDNAAALDLVQDYKNAKRRDKSDEDLEAAIKLYNTN